MRAVIFHPKAREAIREFPKDVRDRLGKGLFRLQMGEALAMPQSRAMPEVGAGVSELRVRGQDGIYRTFYYTASAQGVLVIHAFMKKTQRTPPGEVALAKTRFKELLMPKLTPIVARTPEALAEALGLSAADAKEWQVQYALLKRLKEIVKRQRLTHAQIAERAGTSRTRVTAILNDKLDHVSSDLLIRILASLGYRVSVTVRRSDVAA